MHGLYDPNDSRDNCGFGLIAHLRGEASHQLVRTAIEALASIARQKPDLILVDWNMPNMDGITLIRKVRETDKGLPIIMVTTEAEKARVLEAVKAGVNNYVVKPFTAETLAEKITQTMGRVKATTAAAT